LLNSTPLRRRKQSRNCPVENSTEGYGRDRTGVICNLEPNHIEFLEKITENIATILANKHAGGNPLVKKATCWD
jgi:hypothetical protein